MAKKPQSSDPTVKAFRARLRRVRAAIKGLGHDALLVTNPKDIRYLTGFSGEDSFALVMPRSFHVISDFRFNEQLDAIKHLAKIVLRDGLMPGTVRALVRDMGIRKLAIQAEYMTVAQKSTYAKMLRPIKLTDTTNIFAALRVIKDEAEILSIRKAVRIQQRALKQTLEEIGPGTSETRIAATLEYNMMALGSEGAAFGTIAAVRANSAVPHAVAGKAKAAKNQPLLIDFGATVDGYRSDMTRVFSFGKWNPKVREIYSIVLDAHKAAARALKPGVKCADIDAAARDLITDAGYGEYFGHGLGHGIGLDIHENPRLSKASTDVLKPGMVVTVEPGIYIQGVGGVRLEDDYVITASGAKNLCSLPKDIGWATR